MILLAYLQSSGEGCLRKYGDLEAASSEKSSPRWMLAFLVPQRWRPRPSVNIPSLYTLAPPETPKAMYNLGRIAYSWVGGVGGAHQKPRQASSQPLYSLLLWETARVYRPTHGSLLQEGTADLVKTAALSLRGSLSALWFV